MTLNSSRSTIIALLRSSIDKVLLPYAANIRELILLDFPNHANVGDSAIYLGELEFFKRNLGVIPSIVSDCEYLPAEEIKKSDAPIFLHGGGNFGDVWPQHQQFREDILKRFPGRLVVQLPQSIHYADKSAVGRTARIIEEHGNFILLVRDESAFRFATENFRCKVHKCPDMAFYLDIGTDGATSDDLLLLLRTDHERTGAAIENLPRGSRVADWLDDGRFFKYRVKAETIFQTLAAMHPSKMAARQFYYDKLARGRLRRGIDLLGSSRFIITDRLHTHILSLLLDIPHVVLDNNYGKVFGFIDAWTKPYEKLKLANTLNEAIGIYELRRPSHAH